MRPRFVRQALGGEPARALHMLLAGQPDGARAARAVGGLLGHYNLRAPFWTAAMLSLANFLYGLFVLPESLPKGAGVHVGAVGEVPDVLAGPTRQR